MFPEADQHVGNSRLLNLSKLTQELNHGLQVVTFWTCKVIATSFIQQVCKMGTFISKHAYVFFNSLEVGTMKFIVERKCTDKFIDKFIEMEFTAILHHSAIFKAYDEPHKISTRAMCSMELQQRRLKTTKSPHASRLEHDAQNFPKHCRLRITTFSTNLAGSSSRHVYY